AAATIIASKPAVRSLAADSTEAAARPTTLSCVETQAAPAKGRSIPAVDDTISADGPKLLRLRAAETQPGFGLQEPRALRASGRRPFLPV
ncbi:MAG: hypothetical protein AAFV29_04810, partial [Myxococcota bacterium]